MLLKKNKYWLITLLLLFFASCDDKQFFDRYHTLDGSWAKNDSIRFNFQQNDTVNSYNLFLNIRNNNEYPFSNLYVIVDFKNPKNEVKRDTLEYEMAYPDGKLMGTGFSDIKENKLWYQENFRFKNPGEYQVTIIQAVREANKINGLTALSGITEVGFRIEKTN